MPIERDLLHELPSATPHTSTRCQRPSSFHQTSWVIIIWL